MPFKVTIFFKQEADLSGGWTMNFWNTGTGAGTVKTATDSLVAKLDAVTGNGCFIPYYRLSVVGGFRQTYTKRTGMGPQTITNQSNAADYPVTAVLLNLYADDGSKTPLWLRGVRDGDINTAGKFIPQPGNLPKYKALFAELATNNWAIYVQNTALPKKVINGIDSATGVVTCPGHGFTSGQKVRISRAKGLIQANGVWQVVEGADADHFGLVGWVPPIVVIPYLGGGTAQLQARVFKPITYNIEALNTTGAVRSTSHDTGRPFGQLTGRRRRPKKTQGGIPVAQ